MDDEKLRNIAQVLVNDAIAKAVDKVKNETKEMDEGLDQETDNIVGLTIRRSINAIREGQTSPTDDKMEGMLGNTDTTGSKALDIKDDRSTGTQKGHVTSTHAQMSKASHKKNVLERLLDRIPKRDQKEAKKINAATAGCSTNIEVGGKKKSSSKAHNKRDWIRRNLLCCFVRQTATVEPLSE